MPEQEFILLSALIKLRSRHLKEWETLIAIQQKVWLLSIQELAVKLTSPDIDQRKAITLQVDQAIQIRRIIATQKQDRERMKVQHRDEKVLLNQLYGTEDQTKQ